MVRRMDKCTKLTDRDGTETDKRTEDLLNGGMGISNPRASLQIFLCLASHSFFSFFFAFPSSMKMPTCEVTKRETGRAAGKWGCYAQRYKCIVNMSSRYIGISSSPHPRQLPLSTPVRRSLCPILFAPFSVSAFVDFPSFFPSTSLAT